MNDLSSSKTTGETSLSNAMLSDATLGDTALSIRSVEAQLLHQLREIAINVALGLSRAEGTLAEKFSLPDLQFGHGVFDAPLDAEDVRRTFQRWVITNGLKDAAAAMAQFLGCARDFTPSAPRTESALDDIKELHLPAQVERELRVIDAVGKRLSASHLKVQVDGDRNALPLQLRWWRTPNDGGAAAEIRSFGPDEPINLSGDELNKLLGTLSVLAECVIRSCLGEPPLTSPHADDGDRQIDMELKQTFPASDPLPWSHRVD